MPRSNSATVTDLPGSIHMSDEPLNTGFCDQALRLTRTVSSRARRPNATSSAKI